MAPLNQMPTVVITGASQGMGAAIARAFARESESRLALLARTESNLEEVAAQCREAGAEAAVHRCDVTKDEEVEKACQDVLSRWGAPDVLVNNAGQFIPAPLLETTPADFRSQIDVNLTGAFLVTHQFLEPMVAAGSGDIFFMGSVASIQAYKGNAGYCAGKHGLRGLARVVREETKEKGIRVTTLIPGATHTPSWEGVELPEERFMPAEDIAKMVVNIHQLSGRSVAEEIILRPQEGDI